jgi:8-oxo-dGTP pyrophosphatase MutT (NUDIX family)
MAASNRINNQLASFKLKVQQPLRQATLLFLIKDNEILLAMKKRGFGQGKYNGVGGKVDSGESLEVAAVRETKEEIDVTPVNYWHVANLDFYFPHEPIEKDWNQRVVVYFCDK